MARYGISVKNIYLFIYLFIFDANTVPHFQVSSIDIQYVAKSIATCKKNPCIINQNHIFSKNYCEVISG